MRSAMTKSFLLMSFFAVLCAVACNGDFACSGSSKSTKPSGKSFAGGDQKQTGSDDLNGGASAGGSANGNFSNGGNSSAGNSTADSNSGTTAGGTTAGGSTEGGSNSGGSDGDILGQGGILKANTTHSAKITLQANEADSLRISVELMIGGMTKNQGEITLNPQGKKGTFTGEIPGVCLNNRNTCLHVVATNDDGMVDSNTPNNCNAVTSGRSNTLTMKFDTDGEFILPIGRCDDDFTLMIKCPDSRTTYGKDCPN